MAKAIGSEARNIDIAAEVAAVEATEFLKKSRRVERFEACSIKISLFLKRFSTKCTNLLWAFRQGNQERTQGNENCTGGRSEIGVSSF